MHYYSFHVGDYRKDTGHLSLLEHGIYRLAIDQYFLDESPLPKDMNKLKRMLCVRTADELQALENVLADFFVETDEGYEHERCTRELEIIYGKSKQASKAAKTRWAREKARKINGGGNADAMRTQCGGNADGMRDGMPPINPTPTNPEPSKKHKSPAEAGSIPDCPHQDIIDLYHKHCPTMPRVKIWNDKRKRALKARWRESPKHQSLEFWDAFLEHCGKSPFLRGDVSPEWSASLEWIINPTNFAKIIEGNYHKGAQ